MLPAAGDQRSAVGVPSHSSVLGSFEGLACRAVACPAEDRRVSEADVTRMDLLSRATWSVLEHSLTSATAEVALISVVPSQQCLDQKCPVLFIAKALPARGRPLEFSASQRISWRPCLQCLLLFDQLWEIGIDSIWSSETASFFALSLRGKIVAPKQGTAVYRNMQRDVGADDGLPASTWRTCQNQRPSPWPMQTEMRTSTPPMKSWSPGRTLLGTRCS